MKYLVLIYNDPELLGAMPRPEFNATMRDCLAHADEMRADRKLLQTEMLQPPATARSIRIRKGKQSVVDGPFTETKEFLAGFNIVEAANIDEAVKLAMVFPWATVGSIEVRPILAVDEVRKAVGA